MMKRATVEEEKKKNPELRQEDIDAVRKWIEAQPHLPAITDMTIVLFLHCCYYDVEVAKSTLDKFYAFQYAAPHICCDRDATKAEIIETAKAVGIVILDGRDREGNLVVFQKLLDTDPARYNMDLTIKLAHMISTIWQLENGTSKGTILIYDQRGFGLSHMARGSVSSLRNMISYVQDCAPINVVGIHVIYTNAVIDAILAIFKPFMRSSIFKLIRTYREENLKDLFEIVPQEILPREYGGNAPSVEELSEAGLQKMTEYRDYFLEEDKNIMEAASKVKSKSPGLMGKVGSWVGLGD